MKAALEYATKQGWAVFPVSPKSKKPLTPHGCKDAKKDPRAIRAWWQRWPDASVGVATGSLSNLIVIDEDLDNEKGKDGYTEVTAWERIHGDLPDTIRCITGRGGAHLYYSYTGNDIQNRVDVLWGVDVRGEGGYVIAPPSLHPNGTEYQWEIGPDEQEVAQLNDTARALVEFGAKPADDKQKTTVPTTIPSGERNDTLFRLACSMQAQGLPDAAIKAALEETNRTACAEPLDDAELDVILASALKYAKGELAVMDKAGNWREPIITHKLDKDGNPTAAPAQTIANAMEAIEYDKELFGRIHWNELAYSPYIYGNLPWRSYTGWREWTDVDDSNLRGYVEQNYGMKNATKVMDAFTNVAAKHPIHPIKAMLEQCHEQWDGNKYIHKLLPAMLGAEESDYTTAVMRLVMLGAISRVYKPGCKFDYMMVLVSDQGIGKSSFLRLLAMNDQWFNDNFSTLDGDKAIEKLRGMWIVEMAELQATKRTKDVETIKSFITSRVDTYRVPYGRRTEQRPRMCILTGTSNPTDFLTDRTGNRRFLPVTCNGAKREFDIFANEVATKAIFAQAWGEAMDEYLRAGGNVPLVLPRHLQGEALAAQSRYAEEDPRVGVIQEWLDTTSKNRVCVLQIWYEALGHTYDEPKRTDVNAIHDIMKNNIVGWHAAGKKRSGMYGIQRVYERNG